MATTDFERFLKDNQLDVPSLTTPFHETSKVEAGFMTDKTGMVAKLTSDESVTKKPGLKKLLQSQKVGTTNKYKSPRPKQHTEDVFNLSLEFTTPNVGLEPEYEELQYLDQLESSLVNDYTESDSARQKRYNHNYFDYPYKGSYRRNTNDNKISKWRRKIKLFERKKAKKSETSPLLNHRDTLDNMDVTIISFDDNATRISSDESEDRTDLKELEDGLHTAVKEELSHGRTVPQTTERVFTTTSLTTSKRTTRRYSPATKALYLTTPSRKFEFKSRYEDLEPFKIHKYGNKENYLHTMHNNMLYEKNKTPIPEYSEQPITSKAQIHLAPCRCMKTKVTNELIKTAKTPVTLPYQTNLPIHNNLMKNIPKTKSEEGPKRVQISSQSYKYDVIYHEPGVKPSKYNHGSKYLRYF